MDKSYPSGKMINGNVADTDTPEKCLEKCNLDSNCNFWDKDSNYCRHRSNEGKDGEVETPGSSAGPKNCIFSKCISKNKKHTCHSCLCQIL